MYRLRSKILKLHSENWKKNSRIVFNCASYSILYIDFGKSNNASIGKIRTGDLWCRHTNQPTGSNHRGSLEGARWQAHTKGFILTWQLLKENNLVVFCVKNIVFIYCNTNKIVYFKIKCLRKKLQVTKKMWMVPLGNLNVSNPLPRQHHRYAYFFSMAIYLMFQKRLEIQKSIFRGSISAFTWLPHCGPSGAFASSAFSARPSSSLAR